MRGRIAAISMFCCVLVRCGVLLLAIVVGGSAIDSGLRADVGRCVYVTDQNWPDACVWVQDSPPLIRLDSHNDRDLGSVTTWGWIEGEAGTSETYYSKGIGLSERQFEWTTTGPIDLLVGEAVGAGQWKDARPGTTYRSTGVGAELGVLVWPLEVDVEPGVHEHVQDKTCSEDAKVDVSVWLYDSWTGQSPSKSVPCPAQLPDLPG